MYLTIVPYFVEMVLRRNGYAFNTILCALIIFYSVTHQNDVDYENNGNEEWKRATLSLVCRIYTMTYLTFRCLNKKFEAIKREDELSDEAKTLEDLETDELSFMKRFSHMTRTSLNEILNFMSFLRNTNLLSNVVNEDNVKRVNTSLETIESSGSEIFRQSSEVVEYYLLRSGNAVKRSGTKEVVDVHKLISHVIRVQKRLRIDVNPEKRTKIELTLYKDDHFPEFILSDRTLLSKLLVNVLSNGIKYTNEGYVRIFLGYCRDENEVVIKVEDSGIGDSGIGIKKEILDRIFDPFVKNETGKESFSVGLVITKSIIDRLGGKIEIISDGENEGTQVKVRLPLALPSREDMDRYYDALEREEDEEATVRSVLSSVTDILLVEDNKINLQVFKKQLEVVFDGVTVKPRIHEVKDGLEAMKVLSHLWRWNPLIITDVDMPKCNGIEFCQRARNLPNGENLVIYCVTATITGDERSFAKRHNFDGCSQKPIFLKDMKRIVNFMVNERNRKTLGEQRFRRRMSSQSLPMAAPPSLEDVVPVLPEEKEGKFGKGRMEKVQAKVKKDLIQKRKAVNITKSCDLKKRMLADVGQTIFIGLIHYFVHTQCPQEFQREWNVFRYVFLLSALFQYVLLAVFRWSVETNSTLTVTRNFIVSVIGIETTFLKRMQSVYLVEFAFIIQANESIERFGTTAILTLAIHIRVFLSEIIRPMEVYSPASHSFIEFAELVALFFFLVHVVVLSRRFVEAIRERKIRWKKIIEEKVRMEDDLNLMTSKIGHDLQTPASSLVVYVQEIKSSIETSLSCDNLFHNRKERTSKDHTKVVKVKNSKKHVVFDEALNYFRLVFRGSLKVEIAFQNFLNCCKIKNSMIIKHTASNVHFAEFFESIIRKCEILLDGKTELKFRIDPFFQKHTVSVDIINLRLILLNLVSNTLIHSSAKKIFIKCFVDRKNIKKKDDSEEEAEEETKSQPQEWINVWMKDDGVGIPSSYVEYMESEVHEFHFKERFSNTLGLGLVVSKYLSKRIGAKLRISRRTGSKGTGTIVKFSVPFQVFSRNRIVEEQIDKEEEEEVEGEEDDGEEDDMKKKSTSQLQVNDIYTVLRGKTRSSISVLCVDDCPIIIQYVRMFLRKMEFTDVFTTTNEETAIEKMNERKFDILFTDFHLTKMNSKEMLDHIHEENRPSIVIVVTGSQGVECEDGGKVYFDGVISKPFDLLSVKNTLRRFVDVK